MHLKEDFDSLVGKTLLSDGLDRRDFIKAALGTGFAAAVLPVCAQTMIKTDTAGLTAGEVTITVKGQKVPVYRAQPEGKTGLPVILVVSEAFGVHEHIADVARRFAKLGYLALAPELFVRQINWPLVFFLVKSTSSIAVMLVPLVMRMPPTKNFAPEARSVNHSCIAWFAASPLVVKFRFCT